MRTSKIAALVAATALLVVGSAIAAFAATNGWVEESGAWKYYKNGEAQTETFAKSGDNWYWLDSNGEMATDQLVEYNEYKYYVDQNGCMVKGTWKALPNTDDENMSDTVYYYFQTNGKAFKGGDTATPAWKDINGKKYTFNSDSKMLYGWLDEGGNMVSDENNDAFKTGVYYCGAADDGARVTSNWLKYYCVDGTDVDGDKYFWFGANGKKTTTSKAKTINGKKYAFDDNGIMLAEWVDVTSPASTATGTSAYYAWFQDAETGAKYANGWFKVVPASNLNHTDYLNEDQHWYYADSKGVLAQSTIKTIKGKQYAFNKAGEMLSGLQWAVYNDADGSYTFTAVDDGNDSVLIDYVIDPSKVDARFEQPQAQVKTGLRFFSADADNDGAMKTGNAKVTANGEDYTFTFGTKGSTKGVGFTGKNGSYMYYNGYKFVADSDMKVQALEYSIDGTTGKYIAEAKPVSFRTLLTKTNLNNYFVVSTSGSIAKSTTKTDADGLKATINSNGVITKIVDTNDSNNQVWPR